MRGLGRAARASWTVVALLATAWCATARADDAARGPFRLVWVRGDGTDGCVDRAAIAEGVTQRLGKPVFSDAARRSIETVVQHEGDVWEAHIYVRDDDGKLDGSRILTSHAPTCTPIQSAVTLAIALAIDPEAALRAPPPAPSTPGPASSVPSQPQPAPAPLSAVPTATTPVPAPPPIPVAPPAVPRPSPPCPVARPCPARESAFAPPESTGTVALRAVAAFGLLPGTGPGVSLAAEIPLFRWLRGAGGVLYLPEQPQRTADGTFSFGMTAAWLGACARPVEGARTSLSVCASALVGGLHSVVHALAPLNPGERAWAGASAGAVLRVRVVGPVEAEIGADLVIPLVREAFGVQGSPNAVFQQSPVAAVPFAGAGLSFP